MNQGHSKRSLLWSKEERKGRVERAKAAEGVTWIGRRKTTRKKHGRVRKKEKKAK